MRILVFGHSGQVATELRRRADVIALGRPAVDLARPETCAEAIRAARPDGVINAAAYTAVDRAEDEETLATTMNGTAPGVMARACAELGVPFCHVSTDYVFDGGGTAPWTPGDAVNPCNAYGRSKLAGERAVAEAGGRAAVLRTSWVFSACGGNFVRTMLRLGQTRPALTVVDDQIGGPTPAADIAAALLTMIQHLAQSPEETPVTQIHHLSGQPDTSWAGFAREIFARGGLDVAVTGIPSAEYPTAAARPLNSRLDCASLEAAFGIRRPDWRRGLAAVLRDLGAAA